MDNSGSSASKSVSSDYVSVSSSNKDILDLNTSNSATFANYILYLNKQKKDNDSNNVDLSDPASASSVSEIDSDSDNKDSDKSKDDKSKDDKSSDNQDSSNEYTVDEKVPKGKIKVKKLPKYLFEKEKFKLKVKLKVDGKKVKTKFKFKSSKKKVITVSKKGKLKAHKDGKAKITIKSKTGAKFKFKVKVKDTGKLVALTFDDGPGAETPRLLEAMKKLDYHGTFFVVGKYATNAKDLMKKMLKNGNEIGIHSWNHDSYAYMAQSSVEADIKKMKEMIKDKTGYKPFLVRPPYGAKNDATIAAIKNKNCACVMWNTNIEDYLTTSASVVENNIMSRVHPGAILVIHDSHKWSVDGVIAAMKRLKDKGYELCSISEFTKVKKLSTAPGQIISGTAN